MSSTNGTAVASPVNVPDVAGGESSVDYAGKFLRGVDDTAPLDPGDRTDETTSDSSPEDRAGPSFAPTESPVLVGPAGENIPTREPDGNLVAGVRQLATEVEVSDDWVHLQTSPSLRQRMELEEIEAERLVQAQRRAADREFETWQIARSLRARKWAARRASWRRRLDERAERKDLGSASGDRRWHIRAERTRRRLTSTDARIATQIRSATRWSNVLIALMVVGLVYTGFVVQRNFVPSGDKSDPIYWLALGLEAMCSVALMALMRFDARLGLAGIQRTTWEAVRGWAVKGVLLGASLLAAAGPSIAAGDVMGMVRTGWAAVLVAGVLLIHDRISRGDSEILLRMHRAAARDGLDAIVLKVQFAVEQGLLPPSQSNKEGETAPSASRIASFFRISKSDAAYVRDAVNANAEDTT